MRAALVPRIEDEVDRRVVVNPEQARRLLGAVRLRRPELEAYFGCMYFAALRPEEVLHMCDDDFERPNRVGRWGWFHLAGANVAAGNDWTDDDGAIERRGPKHRGRRRPGTPRSCGNSRRSSAGTSRRSRPVQAGVCP